MTKTDIEHRIIWEIHGLPVHILYEVIDFIKFLKMKYQKEIQEQKAGDKASTEGDFLTRLLD